MCTSWALLISSSASRAWSVGFGVISIGLVGRKMGESSWFEGDLFPSLRGILREGSPWVLVMVFFIYFPSDVVLLRSRLLHAVFCRPWSVLGFSWVQFLQGGVRSGSGPRVFGSLLGQGLFVSGCRSSEGSGRVLPILGRLGCLSPFSVYV